MTSLRRHVRPALVAVVAGVALAAGVAFAVAAPGRAGTVEHVQAVAGRATQGSPARSGTLAAAGGLPADCVPSPTAPPYELGLTTTITGGTLADGPVSIHNLSANLCGVVTVSEVPPCAASGVAVIPADGQVFGAGLKAVVGLVPGQPLAVPFTVIPQPIRVAFGCGSSAGGLQLSTTIEVAGTTGLFGVACEVGPLAIPVTATITSPTGSFSHLVGTFTSTAVDLPTATVSATCPQAVASQLDTLVGLPLPGGTVSLPFVASLYLPQ